MEGTMDVGFKQVAQDALNLYQVLVQTSIESYRSNESNVSIKAGTIVCLFIGADGSLLANWLDDAWNFKFPAEQIIADLDEELVYMLHAFPLSGDVTVVLGELADDLGNLTQAYSCACNVEHVRAVSA
jgi:hypothetical protein